MTQEELIQKIGYENFEIAKKFYGYCKDEGGLSWLDTYDFAEVCIRNDFIPANIRYIVELYATTL